MSDIEFNVNKLNDTQNAFKNLTTLIQRILAKIYNVLIEPSPYSGAIPILFPKEISIQEGIITFKYQEYEMYVKGLIDLKSWLEQNILQGFIEWGILLKEDSKVEHHTLSKDRIQTSKIGKFDIQEDFQYQYFKDGNQSATGSITFEEFESYVTEKLYASLYQWTQDTKYFGVKVEFDVKK